jgi:alkylhydroperoxidase family enzyme
MSRIPLLKSEDFTPEQLEFFRGSATSKLNLSRLLAQGTTVFLPFMELSKAIFAKLDIPPRERELLVLAVIHLERGEYEWAQHVQIAEDMGISREKIDAISQHRFNAAVFNEREHAILAFTRQVVQSVRVDDYVFDALSAFYSSRQIVETVYTIGCYMTVLRISEVAELEIDAVHGAEVVRQAVAQANI